MSADVYQPDYLHSSTVKPRVPTVVSVRNANGIFEIEWKSNMENNVVDESLMANVTYFKKGGTLKVRAPMKLLYSRGPGELYRYSPFMPELYH